MDEQNQELDEELDEGQKAAPAKPEYHSPLEPVYQNFRKVPVKYVDIFIGLCVAALVIVLVVGFLNSKGII